MPNLLEKTVLEHQRETQNLRENKNAAVFTDLSDTTKIMLEELSKV